MADIPLERLSRVEQWQHDHAEIHRLEAVAVKVANDGLSMEMVKLNDVRHRFVDKEEHRREIEMLQKDIRSLRESRSGTESEKGFLEKFWPLALAVAMFVAGHFWK